MVEIEIENKIGEKTIQMDFSNKSESIYDRIGFSNAAQRPAAQFNNIEK